MKNERISSLYSSLDYKELIVSVTLKEVPNIRDETPRESKEVPNPVEPKKKLQNPRSN